VDFLHESDKFSNLSVFHGCIGVCSQIQRNILADKPRVTRFNINWREDQNVGARLVVRRQEQDMDQDSENISPTQNTESLSNLYESDHSPEKRMAPVGEYPAYRDESLDNLDKIFASVEGL
jgi:hypothetical protein